MHEEKISQGTNGRRSSNVGRKISLDKEPSKPLHVLELYWHWTKLPGRKGLKSPPLKERAQVTKPKKNKFWTTIRQKFRSDGGNRISLKKRNPGNIKTNKFKSIAAYNAAMSKWALWTSLKCKWDEIIKNHPRFFDKSRKLFVLPVGFRFQYEQETVFKMGRNCLTISQIVLPLSA